MNVQEVMSRIYAILGDDVTNPRWFTRASLLAYVNRACEIFRSQVNDTWFRVDVPVVANQGVYTFPDNNVRVQRIAFDDQTLDATSVMALQGRDWRWQEEVSSEPFLWTSDGLPHDQYRLWPKPSASSTSTVTFTSELGVVISWPEAGAFSSELGIVVDADGYDFTSELGEITSGATPGIGQQTLWCTEKAGTLSDDAAEIPLPLAFHLAPVYYTVSQVYQEEADHYNSILSAFYRDLFLDQVRRGQARTANPLPRMIHRLRPAQAISSDVRDELRFSETSTPGYSFVPKWPRGA